MLKMVANLDGKDVLVIGLSFGNLNKFRDAPGDTFIKINGKEMGIAMDVIIFSGETEAAMQSQMAEFIGPNTTVYIDPKLKS